MSSQFGIIIFLGPGRSGTTSLYQALKTNPAYRVEDDKEVGALSFSFERYRGAIRESVRDGVFVEVTPSNLLASLTITVNVSNLRLALERYVIIKRPVEERLVSLFLHHRKIGNFYGTFDEYLERSVEFEADWKGWFDGTQDITFAGLAEYQHRLLMVLPQDKVFVVEFSDLFNQTNAFLGNLGLPSLEEVHRNQGYVPKYAALHNFFIYVYRHYGLTRINGLDHLKAIYMRFNARKKDVEMSKQSRDLLAKYELEWTCSLSQFEYVLSQYA